jgi:hypothetical protein
VAKKKGKVKYRTRGPKKTHRSRGKGKHSSKALTMWAMGTGALYGYVEADEKQAEMLAKVPSLKGAGPAGTIGAGLYFVGKSTPVRGAALALLTIGSYKMGGSVKKKAASEGEGADDVSGEVDVE